MEGRKLWIDGDPIEWLETTPPLVDEAPTPTPAPSSENKPYFTDRSKFNVPISFDKFK